MGVNIDCGTGQETIVANNVSLPERKLALVDVIKGIRDAKISGGVTVANVGVFDSDEAARLNITGAVVMAQVALATNVPFLMSWKLADNSLTTLNAQAMVLVGVSVGTHVAACHANAQALAVSVQEAEDHDALDAIDLSEGWPA